MTSHNTDSLNRLPTLQGVAEDLQELLEMLYPEPPSPQVVTLRDVRVRYPLTRLEGPARQALTQAQRINRSLRDHRQLGLCEFHIGLIFLHFKADCHRAVAQFREARRQWNFVDETASVCLTHYAQGLGHFYDPDLEAAMTEFGTAEKLLKRLHFRPGEDAKSFADALQARLDENQERLRERLWPVEPEEADGAGGATQEQATPPPSQPTAKQQPAPQPIDRMNPSTSLIPGHLPAGDQYVWFEVVERRGRFLPQVIEGSWLLVDTSIVDDYDFHPGELLLTVSKSVEIRGSILLTPRLQRTSLASDGRIYLGRIHNPSERQTGAFVRDPETGKITLDINDNRDPILTNNILGTVIGIWAEVEHVLNQ